MSFKSPRLTSKEIIKQLKNNGFIEISQTGSHLKLLTTDYVIDETLTLLRARGELKRSIVLGEAFFSGKLAQIYYLTEDDVRLTWEIFSRFADKEWSFTYCSSKIVMEKLGIVKAFAFDHHFSKFGTVQVFP